jgi:cytochrome c
MNTTLPVALCTLVVAASLAMAAEAPTIEQGRELFNSVNLGTNGKRCASCHPDGRGLGKAAGYEDARLGRIINQCISASLKVWELAPDSGELKSLIMYVHSFGGVGKK